MGISITFYRIYFKGIPSAFRTISERSHYWQGFWLWFSLIIEIHHVKDADMTSI